MSGMPAWLAALQNTQPDDNAVTAECSRKKKKYAGWPPGHVRKDSSRAELVVTVTLGVQLKQLSTLISATQSHPGAGGIASCSSFLTKEEENSGGTPCEREPAPIFKGPDLVGGTPGGPQTEQNRCSL